MSWWYSIGWRTAGLMREEKQPLEAAGLECLGHVEEFLDGGGYLTDLAGVDVRLSMKIVRTLESYRARPDPLRPGTFVSVPTAGETEIRVSYRTWRKSQVELGAAVEARDLAAAAVAEHRRPGKRRLASLAAAERECRRRRRTAREARQEYRRLWAAVHGLPQQAEIFSEEH